MKIAIWKTGHDIADKVAHAVYAGMGGMPPVHADINNLVVQLPHYDLHIGYGILRGMGDVFDECKRLGKPFICIDRGYWKPGHFDGHYRISLNRTQQTANLGELPVNVRRWEKLGIEIEKPVERDGYTLICPPTNYVRSFFDLPNWLCKPAIEQQIIREKDDPTPLAEHLEWASKVVTFNSSVGWEALRRGIPVVSDPDHSIVGAWEKMLDGRETLMNTREHLFSVQAGLQLTLDEIREGKLMPLIEILLNARAA